MPKIADQIADEYIGHTVDLMRLTEDIRPRVIGYLQQMEQDLVRQIGDSGISDTARYSAKLNRLNALLKQTRETIATAYRGSAAQLKSELVTVAEIAKAGTGRIINDVIGMDIASVATNKTMLQALAGDSLIAGAPQAEWWKKQTVDTAMRFQTQMRLGVSAGETNDQLVQRLRGTYTGQRRVIEIDGEKKIVKEFKGGIMDVSTRQAEALVRTSVQSVANEARLQTYKENDDLVKGYQALVTLDTRTSDICRPRSGAAWDLKGNPLPNSPLKIPFPGPPPWHFNCRSTLIPLLKSWDELGSKIKGLPDFPVSTQSSMDGQVAGDLTYENWLKTKPESTQKEVLGEGKWKLWNEGKIKFSDMVDQTGNPLSVAELQQKVGLGVPKVAAAVEGPPLVATKAVRYSGDLGRSKNEFNLKYGTKQPYSKFVEDYPAWAGRPLEEWVSAGIPNTSLFDSAVARGSADVITIRSQIDDIGVVERKLFHLSDGSFVIQNAEFELESKGKGKGTLFFANQVAAAQKLGFSRMETQAIRASDANGYYTWARLGYDAKLPAQVLADIDEGIAAGKVKPWVGESTTLLELTSTPEGLAWWKANGGTLEMTFDLRKGSDSIKRLTDYLKTKGIDVPGLTS